MDDVRFSPHAAFSGPNLAYLSEAYETYCKDPGAVPDDLRGLFGSWQPEAALPLAGDDAVREYGYLRASLDPLVRPAGAPAGLDGLEAIYCGTTGYEFDHMRSREERAWLYDAVESGRFSGQATREQQRAVLTRLTQVEAMEQFLHRSFPGKTWFSIEGTDVLLPMLDVLVSEAGAAGHGALVFGMPHRGRLNVLAHLFGMRYDRLLAAFTGAAQVAAQAVRDRAPGWMRDVDYHLGATRVTDGGVTLRLLPNPSHLELVDPLVLGAVRALQERGTGLSPDAALAVLMHGDAAFSGQGIVAETLNLSGVPGYDVGGTVHIVINNQIGFTTEPWEASGRPFCTDVARGFDIPIIHVNADDVAACLSATRLALGYRQRFHRDAVIDLVGYRRYGHNEGDEPAFTQPLLYQAIAAHPTVRRIWAQHLVEQGIVSEAEEQGLMRECLGALQEARRQVGSGEPVHMDDLQPSGDGSEGLSPAVGVRPAVQLLLDLNQELHRFPEGFTLHPKMERPLKQRRDALTSGSGIDWAHAEALAFASILAGGTPVRLTGQDSGRGTFSQRHAVLHDVRTGGRFCPLAALPSAQAPFSVHNSPLSEEGVLGFEYGYTTAAPEALVLWEAQYGDFVNNAQSVMDEFIASAEAKWGQHSGIVLLLPHGYEGQGPNHSSAHLGRVLELAAEENVQVACCTTAAQYFHLLRQQAGRLRWDPCPLIVLTVKSLLRHPMAVSTLDDLTSGGFQPVIDDPRSPPPEAVQRLVLGSGKVYVDAAADQAFSRADHIAFVRVEQLYPFPSESLAAVLDRYRGAPEIVWLQEEPQNRGAWPHIAPQLERQLPPGARLSYIGLPARPSPAWGSQAFHRAEQQDIINQVFQPVRTSLAPRRSRR